MFPSLLFTVTFKKPYNGVLKFFNDGKFFLETQHMRGEFNYRWDPYARVLMFNAKDTFWDCAPPFIQKCYTDGLAMLTVSEQEV